MCLLYGIKKSRTTAYYPQGNGQCERFNKTLCGLLRSLDAKDRRRWPELIRHIVHMYNTTCHIVTWVTPYFLMFGRSPQLPIDHLLNRLPAQWNVDYVQQQHELMERAYKLVSQRQNVTALKEEKRQKLKEKTVSVVKMGDRVLLRRDAFTGRHKLKDKFDETPYVVVAQNKEGDVYQIRLVLGGQQNGLIDVV